ncbi:MAG: PilZ domain-containing protein [Gammaproteobacteria bacterium]|nr:PilZ domain-containing protein [Gammaproteobacteria bacterium]
MADRTNSDKGKGSFGSNGKTRPTVLSLTIKDNNTLYSAYMPFLKGGGLFVPTNKKYKLGEEVFILLTLLEEKDKIPVAGHIVWMTPIGAQGNRAAGVGIQFKEEEKARGKIEAILGSVLTPDRPTHTL